MKLNLASGAHPLPGFENLDKENGWTFESGLPYPDESVEAVTESHGLMFVALADWPFVLSEIARVLEPGGVVRITEDSALDRRSSRFGGFPGAVTLTTPDLVRDYLELAGLRAEDVAPDFSHFRDDSLIQNYHGGYPKCLFVEGLKP